LTGRAAISTCQRLGKSLAVEDEREARDLADTATAHTTIEYVDGGAVALSASMVESSRDRAALEDPRCHRIALVAVAEPSCGYTSSRN